MKILATGLSGLVGSRIEELLIDKYQFENLSLDTGVDITDSEKIKRARKVNLELIFAQHCEECSDCVFKDKCRLLELAKEYNVKKSRFNDRKKNKPCFEFGPAVFFDSSKCIDCGNCVEVCKKQGNLRLSGALFFQILYLQMKLIEALQKPNQHCLKQWKKEQFLF